MVHKWANKVIDNVQLMARKRERKTRGTGKKKTAYEFNTEKLNQVQTEEAGDFQGAQDFGAYTVASSIGALENSK